MDKKISLILRTIMGIIFSLVSCMLVFQISMAYDKELIIISLIVTFIASLVFYKYTVKDFIRYIKNNTSFSVFSAIIFLWVLLSYAMSKTPLRADELNMYLQNLFRLRYFAVSSISAMYIGIIVLNNIKEKYIGFYNSLDDKDKKLYVALSIIWLCIISVVYTVNNNWFIQYDKVYSIDSGWVFKNIYQDANYYDIRHPMLGIITYPIYTIIATFVKFIFFGDMVNVISAIILQFINVQFLIIICFLLKELTKNKNVFIIYMLSFPTILYSLFFEKYQLCVFLLFLYVYKLCKEQKKISCNITLAVGCMPTSVFIGIGELLTSLNFKEKIKKCLKILCISIVIFVVSGRIRIFKLGLEEINITQDRFSNKSFSFSEKVISTTKLVQSAIFGIPSKMVENNKYWWDKLESNISCLSILMIILIIVGAIKNRKDIFARISMIWSIFAVILFVIFNWSTHESPLFNIYFSWAIIPLIVYGAECIMELFKINKKYFYGILYTLMIVINIVSIIKVGMYVKTL